MQYRRFYEVVCIDSDKFLNLIKNKGDIMINIKDIKNYLVNGLKIPVKNTDISESKQDLIITIPISDIENINFNREFNILKTLEENELKFLLNDCIRDYIRLKKISYTTNLGSTYRNLKKLIKSGQATDTEKLKYKEYEKDIENKTRNFDKMANKLYNAYFYAICDSYGRPYVIDNLQLLQKLFEYDLSSETDFLTFRSVYLRSRIDKIMLARSKNKNPMIPENKSEN